MQRYTLCISWRAFFDPPTDVSIAQSFIEEVTSPDERQVGKGLREVPLRFPGRTDLLGIQPQVVGIAKHLLEILSGLLDASGPCQGLDIPETADAKRPFSAFEPIVGCLISPIAVDMRGMRQFLLNAIQRLEHARVGWGREAGQRDQQRAGVNGVAAIILHEALLLLAPALVHDLLVDSIAHLAPLLQGSRHPLALHRADGALEGYPAHDPRVQEGPVSSTHLPDALVRRLPVPAQPPPDATDLFPSAVVETSVLEQQEQRVEQFPKDIHLQLFGRTIADAHRSALTVAIEVVQQNLGQLRLPANRSEERRVGKECRSQGTQE